MPDDLSSSVIERFQKKVYCHYRNHGRILPWRLTEDPYRILVSEIMLQQTQVERVCPKYALFLSSFPNFETLAHAKLQRVLEVWQGLGYNRRALALKKIAQITVQEFKSTLPSDYATLISLPGIGPATARAIRAFAFNLPEVFIETNIRTVFIHVFFADSQGIKDADIYPLVEQTLDRSNPRTWYYALMDYGVLLKKKYENPSRRSAHSRKQAAFKGSNREVRGRILSLITANPGITETELMRRLDSDPARISLNLAKLESEGFFKRKQNEFIVD